ncbi:metal dependent phosphohydrolase [Caldicellulosiruptor hydrothermalis 108]|uniref:Metal dependent phosphohydrolase n=1 Tax=Caldicellulosiruptor hydrothermalis (strain DSM 18901 / VKM B-2411 / 108) TaxID=632292 RepID=E4QCF6_CALH1|nr:HD domain-containing protein [Caldicellulosiruptor hydrothermalis]ADQ06252.1 metal dependent phosphohydrolase [Caldicellulosiruptor hydrothermalis 108]
MKEKLYEFRDPVHGFIYVRPLELKIIDSSPFQRLRNIKQLAFSHYIYHGAEHSRFGHSLGVMHLVTKAFNTVAEKTQAFDEAKRKWYTQILRIIALVHDLGHAPFSHASEELFPEGCTHEDYTCLIVTQTEISDFIKEIGEEFKKNYGDEYDITPELICSIYKGENIENPDFIFLKKFMDSELDCDKMDYLLRDSLYCGVNYGRFDIERLINTLTVWEDEDHMLYLAIEKGGMHAFEEFVLARYFMFTQVYFHKTRRFLDNALFNFLKEVLPNGQYPKDVYDFLNYDDMYIFQLMKDNIRQNKWAERILKRKIMSKVYETPEHAEKREQDIFNFIKNELSERIGKENLLLDSADKLIHQMPIRYEVDSEKAIPLIDDIEEKPIPVSIASEVIRKMTEPINIKRIYVTEDKKDEAINIVSGILRKMSR